MKNGCSRILAILAAVTTGTLLAGGNCSFGSTPDTGNHCWFICDKSIEKTQVQADSAKPA